MKLINLVGARPQFIKAAVISRAIRSANAISSEQLNEVVVHTGQHYDPQMSQVFFKELGIKPEKHNLKVNGGNHAQMTGLIMQRFDAVIEEEQPDAVLVYGDTNSTLSAALVASKRHIPIFHVEAGLRSFNMRMPEEINRKLTDSVSALHFVPTEQARENLHNEGIVSGIHFVGDVMQDAITQFSHITTKREDTLAKYDLPSQDFAVCTLHREENTLTPEVLGKAIACLNWLTEQIKLVFPMHPGTANKIRKWSVPISEEIIVLPPLSYLDMLALTKHCKLVITDSGGLQKEAYMLKKPCITLREETEWRETLNCGWNQLTGIRLDAVRKSFLTSPPSLQDWTPLYGNSDAGDKIISTIRTFLFGSARHL